MNTRFDCLVSVFTETAGTISARFVTSIPSRSAAAWEPGKPAMVFSESYAKDIVFGLTLNGHAAAVVKVLHGVSFKNPE